MNTSRRSFLGIFAAAAAALTLPPKVVAVKEETPLPPIKVDELPYKGGRLIGPRDCENYRRIMHSTCGMSRESAHAALDNFYDAQLWQQSRWGDDDGGERTPVSATVQVHYGC